MLFFVLIKECNVEKNCLIVYLVIDVICVVVDKYIS